MSTWVQRLTPAGSGGVAVLAVRGPEACRRVERLAKRLPEVGEVCLAQLSLDGDLLDESLVTRRAHDHFELGLHGGPGLVAEVLEALGGGGDSPPQGVEDLALAALTEAPCDRAARVLLDQARGSLRREALAGSAPRGGWLGVFERYRYLLQPAKVVLAGPVNAGKSTLFNLLVGHERVNVSHEEGTTRDAITARVRVGHYAVDLVDTAGERVLEPFGAHTAAAVEEQGQALGQALRARADLVLWLSPDGEAPPPGGRVRCLHSLADDGPEGGLSALRRPAEAVTLVNGLVREALELSSDDPWVPGAPVPPTGQIARALDKALERPAGPDRDEALGGALGPEDPLPLP